MTTTFALNSVSHLTILSSLLLLKEKKLGRPFESWPNPAKHYWENGGVRGQLTCGGLRTKEDLLRTWQGESRKEGMKKGGLGCLKCILPHEVMFYGGGGKGGRGK